MAARKGVVLETGNNWAIILYPDGKYKKIKTAAYLEVGQLYADQNSLVVKYAVAAAVFFIIILAGFDYFSVQAYAQVSPHVELGVNRWGRVVSVEAQDEDGQRILDGMDMQNDKLEAAVEKIYNQTLNKEDRSEALTEKPTVSVVTTSKKDQVLEQKILDKVDKGLQKAREVKKQNSELKKENIQKEKEKINKIDKNKKENNQNGKDQIDRIDKNKKENKADGKKGDKLKKQTGPRDPQPHWDKPDKNSGHKPKHDSSGNEKHKQSDADK